MDMVENRRHYLGIHKFDSRVVDVMRKIDRGNFVPTGTPGVYEDDPVPIGSGQTCSQPSMVAAMATLLQLAPGQKILEVGTGCGYSTAVAAMLLRPGGVLHTIEFVPELSERARASLALLDSIDNVRFNVGDGSLGLPEQAPFDRIYLTAGVGRYFNEHIFLDQLKPEGILLYPEAHGAMHMIRKTPAGLDKQALGGVGFVFLQGDNSGFD